MSHAETAVGGPGLLVARRFTSPGKDPLDEVLWEKRPSVIKDADGKEVFRGEAEIPKDWPQLSADIAVSKYLRQTGVAPDGCETSVRQLFERVASSIREAGESLGGYFASPADAESFEAELKYMLVHQMGAFNSPVFFNVGLSRYGIKGSGGNWHWDGKTGAVRQSVDAYSHPQCSACFIQALDDHLASIFELSKNEARIFKYGSGSGTNFSRIRSRYERLSGGGTPSGLMFFLEVLDKGAGAIKSGGVARRAAKMVCLDMDHPEILDFIQWKQREEKKVAVLIAAGYPSDFNGEAYRTVSGQNSNNSVRVSDEFMEAALADGKWKTTLRTTGETHQEYEAKKLLNAVSQAAWSCADPGMQFTGAIQAWHTCPETDNIRSSNPCVTGDSLVSTSQGYRRILDLVGHEVEIMAGDGSPKWVSRIFHTGRKPIYELKTASGYRLRLTADHRVMTANRGDVPAFELTKDDRVVIGGVGFGKDNIPADIAELVGLAVGDGCLNSQGYLMINMDRLLERGILEGAQNTINRLKPNKFGSVRESGSTARVATCAPEIVEIAKSYAVLNEGSEGKRLTDACFSFDKGSQSALLRGLFTSDGTVGNYGEKSQYVALDSVSLQLLQQVQLLLLGFGIKAKLYENRRAGPLVSLLPDGKGGRREYAVKQIHSLRISRSSRLVFQREIGFMPDSPKAARLSELNALVGTYAEVMTDAVESLVSAGEEDVYDLTEPRTHHFIANGIVVHNCSEYMFLDDTACNLASLNLVKFMRPDRSFDIDGYRHAARVFFLAQEIMVDYSSYPTQKIAQNSHDYRPLGLGYSNLGALLMLSGIPYDSSEGRALCGALTAVLTGRAYQTSAEIARNKGPFAGFAKNREAMLAVMAKHRAAVEKIETGAPAGLQDAARQDWDEALKAGKLWGYRNAQATVLAPTGTIGLLMGCDTTGIEPEFALVKVKKLVGGGTVTIANESIAEALRRLGYSSKDVSKITAHAAATGGLEDAKALKREHLAVFDCANPCGGGKRFIEPLGHVRMMAAAQPFLSGAISKTVNLPHKSTVADIEQVYIEAWKLGLKALAVYRDGCKLSQPLTVSGGKEGSEPSRNAKTAQAVLERRWLPQRRNGFTQELTLAGQKFYLKTGEYEDGSLGEFFIEGGKAGSPLKALLSSIATSCSLGLQYGVPLSELVDRFAFTRFEPMGPVSHPYVKNAGSILDLIFRVLAIEYLERDDLAHVKPDRKAASKPAKKAPLKPASGINAQAGKLMGDAPLCHTCGHITVRNASCYMCINCGNSMGCS